ncbi:hypothetical protein MTP99_008135 [Tenebrio molitor]|jgi:hypothetical protein|nr:hypothetical protein MTP99_008135 [Tenebrio molitor]
MLIAEGEWQSRSRLWVAVVSYAQNRERHTWGLLFFYRRKVCSAWREVLRVTPCSRAWSSCCRGRLGSHATTLLRVDHPLALAMRRHLFAGGVVVCVSVMFLGRRGGGRTLGDGSHIQRLTETTRGEQTVRRDVVCCRTKRHGASTVGDVSKPSRILG